MTAKLERYLPPAFLSLVFLLTFICLYFGAMPIFADPDTSWHLAAGDLILNQRALPATDSWSFTAAGQVWYNISWLWDVSIELVRRAFGLGGVFMFSVLLMSGVLTLLAHALQKRAIIGSDALVLTLFLTSLSLVEYSAPRPHIVGYFMIVIMQMLLHDSRSNERSRALFAIPAMMVLWANTHGSFLAGFTLMGAYGLEALMIKRTAWFKQLLLVGALSLVAVCINPYGIHIVDGVSRTLSSVAQSYIIEWQPFSFGMSVGLTVVFMLFVFMGPLREKGVPLADKILSLVWLVAMLMSMRNAMIFLLVSAPALAVALHSFSKDMAAFITPHPDILQKLANPKLRLRAAAALLAAVVILPLVKGDRAVIPDQDIGPAIAWLKEHATGKRVLNDYEYGGRIAFETHGAVPIFVDSRAGTAYPEQALKDYIAFMEQSPGWKKVMANYPIDAILTSNASRFSQAFAAGEYKREWQQAYTDNVASVYLRKK